jgi:hypothetical protein
MKDMSRLSKEKQTLQTMNDVNIILEGVDRVGKTTLAKSLEETHEYYKMVPPTSINETFYRYILYFMRIDSYMQPVKPTIYDRGHITEQAYGRLYRPLDYEDGVLDHWLNWKEVTIIKNQRRFAHMRPTVVVYIEPGNLNLMEPDERVNGNVKQELAMYERILQRTHLPVYRVKTQTAFGWKSTKEVVDEIKELTANV